MFGSGGQQTWFPISLGHTQLSQEALEMTRVSTQVLWVHDWQGSAVLLMGTTQANMPKCKDFHQG